MNKNEPWVSMEEICNHLGVSRDTVKKMVRMQNMPGYKIDRKWKFKISEVDEWMHSKNCITRKEGEENKDVKDY